MSYTFSNADDSTKDLVWAKGGPISGFDSSEWRHDICGAVMRKSHHGDRESEHGWEIDHKKPVSLGGSDDLANLQPLHWANNSRKADTYPWKCSDK